MSTIERESIHKAAFGTIDYYAELIHKIARNSNSVDRVALGAIDGILGTDGITDADRVEHIGNVLAAAKTVRDRMQAAGR